MDRYQMKPFFVQAEQLTEPRNVLGTAGEPGDWHIKREDDYEFILKNEDFQKAYALCVPDGEQAPKGHFKFAYQADEPPGLNEEQAAALQVAQDTYACLLISTGTLRFAESKFIEAIGAIEENMPALREGKSSITREEALHLSLATLVPLVRLLYGTAQNIRLNCDRIQEQYGKADEEKQAEAEAQPEASEPAEQREGAAQ